VWWLERALERSSVTASADRVQAVVAAGMLATYQGDYAHAATFSGTGLMLAREFDDPLQVGRALTVAGFLAYRQGEYGPAIALLNEGYGHLSQLADTVPAARADAGFALLTLGSIALAQEQFDQAERHQQGALALFQRAGNDWGIGEAHNALGAVSYCTGNFMRAALLYGESLGQARHVGDPLLLESSLHGLAGVAAESGQPEAGARLLGAAERIIASLGAPAYPRDQPVRTRVRAALAEALGLDRLSAAREAGRALTPEAAIDAAEAVAATVMATP
jgi:tetratricopeptide (TPR) repeat protein